MAQGKLRARTALFSIAFRQYRRRDQDLSAASPTAGAKRPIGLNDHMPYVTKALIGKPQWTPIDGHSYSQAGTCRKTEETVRASTRAEAVLRHASRVRIHFELDARFESLHKMITKRKVFEPGKVRVIDHAAALGIQESRDGDSKAYELVLFCSGGFPDALKQTAKSIGERVCIRTSRGN